MKFDNYDVARHVYERINCYFISFRHLSRYLKLRFHIYLDHILHIAFQNMTLSMR